MVDTRKQSRKMSSNSGEESSGGVQGFLTPNSSDRMSNDIRAESPAFNSRMNANLNTEYE